MEYRTMNRKELAAEMGLSTEQLRRRMKKQLPIDFLDDIEGEILLENHVQYIHEKLSGKNKAWNQLNDKS